RRLGVERVEDRLDEQQVHAALGEGRDLLRIRRAYLVERHCPVRRIVDPRRQRQGDVQRSDRPGDEAAAGLVRGWARQLRTAQVHLAYQPFEPVVGLADARGRERVRGRDVRAGGQVLPVYVQDQVRPGEVEQIRVAGDIAWVLADHV